MIRIFLYQYVFDILRTATIDANQFMFCSCRYYEHVLLPCRYICAVLNDKEYVEPSMCHVWWYKDFNYYYSNTFSLQMVPELNDLLKKILKMTGFKHYYDTQIFLISVLPWCYWTFVNTLWQNINNNYSCIGLCSVSIQHIVAMPNI